MQRFLITNADKFTGQAELVYNISGVLTIIDCSNTDMNAETVRHFKNVAPATVHLLGSSFTAATTIVEANTEYSFEMFYKDWPYKRNAHMAKKIWEKMSNTDKVIAFHNKKDYINYCRRMQAKFDYQALMADSYLRKKEYETDWNKLK